LISFSLEGSEEMAALPPPFFPEPLIDPDFMIDDERATRGAILYGSCSSCHGGGALAGGMAPDLRASVLVSNKETFTSVVRDGELTGRGMPGWSELTDENLEDLQHYIRQRAVETSNPENTNNARTDEGSH
jgi:quinohemoprotein ethanol dehydrogenase